MVLTYTNHVRGDVPHLIHSESAKEYLTTTTIVAALEFGTHTKTIALHNREQNGFSQRHNRTIMNVDRAVMRSAGMPHTYWPMEVNDKAHEHKLLEHSTTDKSPLQQWNENKVQLPPLHVYLAKLAESQTCQLQKVSVQRTSIPLRRH